MKLAISGLVVLGMTLAAAAMAVHLDQSIADWLGRLSGPMIVYFVIASIVSRSLSNWYARLAVGTAIGFVVLFLTFAREVQHRRAIREVRGEIIAVLDESTRVQAALFGDALGVVVEGSSDEALLDPGERAHLARAVREARSQLPSLVSESERAAEKFSKDVEQILDRTPWADVSGFQRGVEGGRDRGRQSLAHLDRALLELEALVSFISTRPTIEKVDGVLVFDSDEEAAEYNRHADAFNAALAELQELERDAHDRGRSLMDTLDSL